MTVITASRVRIVWHKFYQIPPQPSKEAHLCFKDSRSMPDNLVPLSPQHLGPTLQAQLRAPRVELLDDGAQDDLEQLVAGQVALAGTLVGDGVDDVADLGLLVELVVEVVERLLALDVGASQAEQLDAHLVLRRVGGVQLARDVDDGRLDVVVEGARRQHDQVQRRALLARLKLLDVPIQQLPTASRRVSGCVT